MAFRGVTFASQNVPQKHDRGLYMAHHGNGILWGCEMNISGDELIVQSGELIAGGAVVQVDGATPVDLSGRTIQTGYIQVILNIDLTQGEGQQVYETFVESASTAFPDLTQEDIWSTGELHQIQLAIVQISGGNLTSITSSLSYSSVIVSNGSEYGMVYVSAGGNTSLRGFDSSGNILGGIHAGASGTVNIYGNGDGNIYLRPNGVGTTAGEVYLDNNGQIHNGCTYTHDEKTTSTSYAGGSAVVSLGNLTLEAVGKYLVIGHILYTPTTSGLQLYTGALSTSPTTINSSSAWASSGYTQSTAGHFITCAQLFSVGSSDQTIYLNFRASTANGGSIGAWFIRALRIG